MTPMDVRQHDPSASTFDVAAARVLLSPKSRHRALKPISNSLQGVQEPFNGTQSAAVTPLR